MTEAIAAPAAATPAAPVPAAAAAPPAAAPTPPAAAAPPPPAAASAPASVLAGAAATEVDNPEDASKPWNPPEKFRVMKADGTLDEAATARKIDGAYRNAQGRLGTGDVRPKAAADYVFTPPEALKEVFKTDDPELGKIRDEAHKLGVTQKQLDYFMGQYYEKAQVLVGGAVQLDQAAATTELQKVWATPESFKQNAGNAYKALQSFGGDLTDAAMERYGNDPVALQIFARIGAQLGEDKSISGGAGVSAPDINALLAHPAYSNAKHPEHAAITAKVNAHFAAQPGANNPA
jgi:hypothetical protein